MEEIFQVPRNFHSSIPSHPNPSHPIYFTQRTYLLIVGLFVFVGLLTAIGKNNKFSISGLHEQNLNFHLDLIGPTAQKSGADMITFQTQDQIRWLCRRSTRLKPKFGCPFDKPRLSSIVHGIDMAFLFELISISGHRKNFN